MFVLIKCTTCRVGCDNEQVYEFEDSITEEELQTYADECAKDNADMYGIIEDEMEAAEDSGFEFEECQCYEGSYEILNMTKEEIEEEYGEIQPS